ncbi:hypothetical protein ANN_01930 [Periplaneta americana]|uniref:HTH CENPB-type domain-containing protein n=1 Tax=Periplaneta americana TaxID=6978 RepID=A0ABQ8TW15_PERAM|nr:hypothetical protein ANN_01930 [Periplaneta americana]
MAGLCEGGNEPAGSLISTLKDKVNSKEEDVDKLVSTKLGRKPVLPFELEDSLVSYCLEMEKRFFGLSAKDVKTMAFQLASLNGLKHPFSKNDEAAGWKWLHSFLRRHQELSLRKPQSTSMARIRGFNQENPLDVAFMLPFKTYNAQAFEQWLKQNAGRVVTHYQVGMLLGEAFNKAATVAVATNGFRKTGLYPCNRHIFSDFEFQEASQITMKQVTIHLKLYQIDYMMPTLLNLGQALARKSPTDKKTYERKSVQKKQADKVPTQRKRQKKQSQISSDSEGEELDDPVYISTDNEDSEDDAECPYCNGKFSCDKRGEKWIVCTKCGIWCHEECSGEDDYRSFICVYCLEG